VKVPADATLALVLFPDASRQCPVGRAPGLV